MGLFYWTERPLACYHGQTERILAETVRVGTTGTDTGVHLEEGDELYLATSRMEDEARRIIFCVSLEHSDLEHNDLI